MNYVGSFSFGIDKKKIYIQIVLHLGGGEITESQARSRLVQDNRNPGMRLRVSL